MRNGGIIGERGACQRKCARRNLHERCACGKEKSQSNLNAHWCYFSQGVAADLFNPLRCPKEPPMKRVGVTGASGFIGRALVAALVERGDSVRAFVRNPHVAADVRKPHAAADLAVVFPREVDVRRIDLAYGKIADIAAGIAGLDALIHLSGETVAGRWSEEKKRRIHDSRELTTRNLVTAMWECQQRPPVFLSASASGYYGSRGDEPLTESSAPGTDFLAHVCIDWEREAQVAEEFGTRVIRLRQGLVLGRGGGALEAMLPPFRFGVGGPLGSGRQWWPWIHLEDAIALFLFALDREDLSGAVNAAAPDLATNARFAQALGYAMRRPSLMPAPALALKIALGEFSDSLTGSQLMLPAVAEDAGFIWKHPGLDRALLDLIDPSGGRPPGIQRFEAAELVSAPLSKVFALFSDAGNLESLTPPQLRLHMLTPRPIEVQRGAVIEYDLKIRGIPVRWKTLITQWKPPTSFEDIQLRGPYLAWRHRHEFASGGKGVSVRDSVDYALGLAPLSNVALAMVRGDLKIIFEYRRQQLRQLLEKASS